MGYSFVKDDHFLEKNRSVKSSQITTMAKIILCKFGEDKCKKRKKKQKALLTQMSAKMFDKFDAVVSFLPKLHMTIGTCRYNKVRALKENSLEKK
jgi:hypothetical protein